MAWLHTLILWWAVACIYLDGLPDATWCTEKRGCFCPCATSELAKSGRSFLKGLLTNLANPKAIIYFGWCLAVCR
ncbi:hypothetical protein ACNKHN_21985 [Shigella flexneri]